MKYLLDTNVCIVYLNDSHAHVVLKLKAMKPDDVFLWRIT